MSKRLTVFENGAFLPIAGMALIMSLALMLSTAQAEQYEITELGTLGGIWSGPSQLDNQGRVVGGSTIQSGAWHGFSWSNGQMTDLGVPDDYLVSSSTGFNSSGQIVGYANGQYQSQYAYIWEDNVWTYLGTLPGPGLDYSVASGINNNSQIIGYSFTLGPGSMMRGWIWENDVMTDLGDLGGDKSSANAINEQGQIVGYSQIYDPDNYYTHAFIWENGTMSDLGVLPGEVNSAANDINDYGQIVGSSSHQMETYPFLSVYRPCLWDNGQIIDLGLPQGYARGVATGINNDGTIVGWMATTLSGGTKHAFVWRDGVLTNLNSIVPPNSGWELQSASDINDNGQIIGSGSAPSGSIQGFLLTPVLTGVEDDIAETLPTKFVKLNNYPNPFNTITTISYSLPRTANVSIEIYDILGRSVETINEGLQNAGDHQVIWDAQDQPTGLYFYRFQAGDITVMNKMALLK
jgi:probable HAF family extracellular repeat protein